MPYTDFDLMQMQAEALFVHDANGRLLRVNEPEPEPMVPAPRFFLGRTTAGNLWRTRHDLPDDLATDLVRLAADEPIVTDLRQLPIHLADYTALLERHAPITDTNAGPAYALPELGAPAPAQIITAENRALLQAHFSWLVDTLADYAPVAASVADGVAVAVCFCSRITARVAEAGLYTQASFRGRGLATAAVRGWATAVRASGRQPLYSTSWDNLASQAVARKVGAVQYGEDFSIA